MQCASRHVQCDGAQHDALPRHHVKSAAASRNIGTSLWSSSSRRPNAAPSSLEEQPTVILRRPKGAKTPRPNQDTFTYKYKCFDSADSAHCDLSFDRRLDSIKYSTNQHVAAWFLLQNATFNCCTNSQTPKPQLAAKQFICQLFLLLSPNLILIFPSRCPMKFINDFPMKLRKAMAK